MAVKAPEFPFVPKSTSYLRPGMFWEIPLRDGSYACGRVLHLEGASRKRRPYHFWAGLLHWHGSSLPTAADIAGAAILWQGTFELKSIARTGAMIRDCLPPEADGLVIPPLLTSVLNGQVMVGYELTRDATDEEFRTLPVKTIGESNESFRMHAEDVFLDGKPLRWLKCVEEDNALRDHVGVKTPGDLPKVEAELAKAWEKRRKTRKK